jgi:hypothetical protein
MPAFCCGHPFGFDPPPEIRYLLKCAGDGTPASKRPEVPRPLFS